MKKILILILILFITGCSDNSYNCNDGIASSWQIAMPSNTKEIYHLNSRLAFNGDGIYYHVYTYENDEDIANWLTFSNKQDSTYFHDNYKEAIDSWLSEIHKINKEPIEYKNSAYYYNCQDDYSEIIIVLNKDNKKIYIIESFM